MFNNKLKLIAASSSLFILILAVIIFGAVRRSGQPSSGLSPTAATVSPQPTSLSTLRLVTIDPVNGASGVDLSTNIVVTFNRPVLENEVSLEFLDKAFKPVSFDYGIVRDKLTLDPDENLTENSIYTLRVRDQNVRVIGETSFLTKTVTVEEDTRPVTAVTETVIRTRRERPDVFLANELPYESFDFNMVREVNSEGYFVFVVTSNRLAGETLKDAVKQWLLKLELSNEQIATLNIVYR